MDKDEGRETTVIKTVEPPDGGWGWLVVVAGFANFFLPLGILRSYGILYLYLKDAFPESTAVEASWIPALMSTLTYLGASFSGFLCQKLGERVADLIGAVLICTGLIASFFANGIFYLCISFGIIFGLGCSICSTCGIFLTAKYFKKKRAFTIGIIMGGASVGSFVLPPVIEKLCEEFGFRGAMLLMGGASLNLCALAYCFRPLPTTKSTGISRPDEENCEVKDHRLEISSETDEEVTKNLITAQKKDTENISVLGLLKQKIFIAIALSALFYRLPVPHALFFVPDHATSRGIDKINSAYLLSANGICDIVGRMGFGWISDRNWFTRVRGFSLACVLTAIAALALPYSYSYESLMFCMVAFGLGAGASTPLINVILSDEYGAENISTTLGITMTIQGFSALISSPIAGIIKDFSGQYSQVFILFGLSLIASGCLMEVVTFVKAVRKRREKITPDIVKSLPF